jgi:hypothetical protein
VFVPDVTDTASRYREESEEVRKCPQGKALVASFRNHSNQHWLALVTRIVLAKVNYTLHRATKVQRRGRRVMLYSFFNPGSGSE